MKSKYCTAHASKRMQQRAISAMQVKLIEIFGEEMYQKGGTYSSRITDKTLSELKHAINKIQDIQIVSNETGRIITAMHKTRRTHATQYVV